MLTAIFFFLMIVIQMFYNIKCTIRKKWDIFKRNVIPKFLDTIIYMFNINKLSISVYIS